MSFDPRPEIETMHMIAASLAMDRLQSVGVKEHMSVIGQDLEEGESHFLDVADAMVGVMQKQYMDRKEHDQEQWDPVESMRLSFLSGFFFGRAFEEFQVMRLVHDGDFMST